MELIIKTEISDKDIIELKRMGYDINFPFSTKVTLDYGDKIIYGYGKIKTKNEEQNYEIEEFDDLHNS